MFQKACQNALNIIIYANYNKSLKNYKLITRFLSLISETVTVDRKNPNFQSSLILQNAFCWKGILARFTWQKPINTINIQRDLNSLYPFQVCFVI